MDLEGSPLERARRQYTPKQPSFFKHLNYLEFLKEDIENKNREAGKIQELFPNTFGGSLLRLKETKKERSFLPVRVGVVFSGGPASGGHNVISGLYDTLKNMAGESQLFGFLEGPGGIVDGKYEELKEEELELFRNQGGFDLIGSGRTKIESKEQLEKALKTCLELDLDGLVIIGGDDSNTNGAILAEYFIQNGCGTRVIGVPKTIDGDLKGDHIETTFGFDTAAKIYSNAIGSIARDAVSSGKYYHFVRVMGRSASHIALECALQTHPNFVIISEEVEAKKQTLKSITMQIADMIERRAAIHKHYGVIVLPEGVIEFATDMRSLISELNCMNAESNSLDFKNELKNKLSQESENTFFSLPGRIQDQLLRDRDPHGNVEVSKIDTEQLLIDLVSVEMKKRKENGSYTGNFSGQQHFLGYEGRCALPSNFDADYCYCLGVTTALLIQEKVTGYIAFVENLGKPVKNWKVGGYPTSMMLGMETRHGKDKPVIRKTLVDLKGKPFLKMEEKRKMWETRDEYIVPGPIQYFGDPLLTDVKTITMELELS